MLIFLRVRYKYEFQTEVQRGHHPKMLTRVSAVVNAWNTAQYHYCQLRRTLSAPRAYPMTRRRAPPVSNFEWLPRANAPAKPYVTHIFLLLTVFPITLRKRQPRSFQLPRVAGRPTLGGAPRPMPQRRPARSAVRVSVTLRVAKKHSRNYGHFQLPWPLSPPGLRCFIYLCLIMFDVPGLYLCVFTCINVALLHNDLSV